MLPHSSIYVEAAPDRSRLLYSFKFDPELVEAVKAVPGARWDPAVRRWESPINCLVRSTILNGKHGAFQFSLEARSALGRCLTIREDHAAGGLANPSSSRVHLPSLAGPLALFPHQVYAVEALASRDRFLLADEMGLGKTRVLLSLLLAGRVRGGLIIAPLSAWSAWLKEWGLLPSLPQLVALDGPRAKREHALSMLARQESSAKGPSGGGFLLTNYDRLREDWKEGERNFRSLVKGGALVLDECHAVKETSAKRTKVVLDLAESASRVWCASGTPAPNSPLDLYVPLQLAGNFWRSRWEFEARYAEKRERYVGGGRKIMEIVGTKNLPELTAAFDAVALRRTKVECLDLPPKIRSEVFFDLTGENRKVYDAMRKEFLYSWKDLDPAASLGSLAFSAMERLTRLFEICSGFLRRGDPEEGGRIEWIEGADKWKAASELVEDQAPTVFYGRFTPTVKRRALDPSSDYIDGSVSAKDRARKIADFEAGDFKNFYIQVAVAEGFTITRSQRAVFLERDWRPAVNLQAEDRLHRIGQKGVVNVYILRARKTVEDRLASLLEAKGSEIALTVGDVRQAISQEGEA